MDKMIKRCGKCKYWVYTTHTKHNNMSYANTCHNKKSTYFRQPTKIYDLCDLKENSIEICSGKINKE